MRTEVHGLLSLSETLHRDNHSLVVTTSFFKLRYCFHTSDLFIITFKSCNPCFLKCESRVDSNVYVTCISVASPSQLLIN